MAETHEFGAGYVVRMKRKVQELNTLNFAEITQTKQGMTPIRHSVSQTG